MPKRKNPKPAAKLRDPWLDNAKFILIAFVVFGHMLEPSFRDPVVRAMYTWIYLWHMPAFVLIAGLLARPPRDVPDWLASWLPIAVTYVIFQLAYRAYDVFVTGRLNTVLDLTTPRWILWFLFSLVCWRAVVPLLARAPRAFVVLAFAGALAIGVTGASFKFSLARTFYFFPFFALGFALRGVGHVALRERLTGLGSRVAAGACFAAAVAFVLFVSSDYRPYWGRIAYKVFGWSSAEGVAYRALALVASSALSLSLLAWTPARPTALTSFGAATLYVYLWHGFIVHYPAIQSWLKTAFPESFVVPALSLAVIALLLVVALASPWVVRATRWAVEPPIARWLRGVPTAGRAASAP